MPVLEENARIKKKRSKRTISNNTFECFFNTSNLQQLPYISGSVESNLILLF